MSVDIQYYVDVLKYDVLKQPSFYDYTALPDVINFDSHYDEGKQLHWLESEELPGFYVTGRNKLELAKNVTETLLVYFDVPTYFARKWRPENQKFNFENKKTGEHEYVSLDYENELKQATA
jgi:hypothetical protein